MSVVALLTAGILVMPIGLPATMSPAVAQPADGAAFEAARDAAVAASGVFSKGTTLIVRASDPLEGSSIEMSVNPDGSLMWLEAQPTATYVMKCMRVDRCWEMSAADFGDLKWHLIGPGWVTYRQGADFWAYWIDGSWPTGTTYDVSTGADGSQTFVATYAPPGGSVVESTTVSAGAVSDVVLATLSDGTVVGHLTMEMRSQPDRVVVTPPARRSLDGPAVEPTSWEALINS